MNIKFNKRGAIELSINFLVILIISLVVFGSGLTLFWKIYESGEEQLGQISRTIEQRIITQLHGGAKVSVVPRSVDLDRNEEYIVGIGINNLHTETKVFKIFAERGLFVRDEFTCSFYDKDFQMGGSADSCVDDHDMLPLKLLGDRAELRVESNNQEISNIMVKADKKALSGKYTINICVCHDACSDYETCKAQPYDTNYPISKIRVDVR